MARARTAEWGLLHIFQRKFRVGCFWPSLGEDDVFLGGRRIDLSPREQAETPHKAGKEKVTI